MRNAEVSTQFCVRFAARHLHPVCVAVELLQGKEIFSQHLPYWAPISGRGSADLDNFSSQ